MSNPGKCFRQKQSKKNKQKTTTSSTIRYDVTNKQLIGSSC